MALINCPECKKEMSDTTHKCLNCGFVLNKPKRSVTGIIFKGLFITFNSIMIIMLLSTWFFTSTAIENSEVSTIATASSTFILFMIWMFIGIPLALMSYLTRPKAYE